MDIKYFIIVIAIMIVQSIHTWYVVDSFSRISQEWIKITQGVLFMGIPGAIILAAVYDGNTPFALGAAFFEFLINIYYYGKDFFENGYKNFAKEDRKSKRLNSTLVWWRKNWAAMIFAATFPAGIYFCSEFMID